MTMGRWFSWILAGVLLTSSAHAADSDSERQGEAILREALSASKRGDFAQAREAFLRAAALIPRGSVWRNLGLAEMKLGLPVEALKHYRLAASSSDLDADKRSVLEQNMRDAYAATGHIEVRASAGTAVSVDGVAVVDGAREPVDVMPGKHVVDASSATVGAKRARVEVDATPNAVVVADVRIAEETPVPSGSASATRATIVTSDEPSQRDSVLPGGQAESYWNTRRSLGAVLGAIGAVSLGMATFFFAQVENDKSAAQAITSGASPSACAGGSPSSSCVRLENAYSSQQSSATLTLVFLGTGSAALLGGAVLWLWPERASSHLSIEPLIVPQGAGLRLQGGL